MQSEAVSRLTGKVENALNVGNSSKDDALSLIGVTKRRRA